MNVIDNLIALDFIGKPRRWAPRDRFAMIEDPREPGGERIRCPKGRGLSVEGRSALATAPAVTRSSLSI
ncbi:MAG: hypothetical protein M3178_14625 [Pseudomonadota bacterium]|nr:hypothetical protein [Pseudomonadota bacterium]